MKPKIQILSDKINSFDYYYEMSDDFSKFEPGMYAQNEIKAEMQNLSPQELHKLLSLITVERTHVDRYFDFSGAVAPKTFRSEVFRTAWSYVKEGLYVSFSQALRAAWRRFKLNRALRQGIAYFSFTKANGDVREAIGTLLNHNYQYDYKGAQRKENKQILKYWDIQKRAWRACRIDRLISIS